MVAEPIHHALAAVATLCDKDALALYERLFKWAIRLKCDPDLAQDMASEALCASLQEGCPEWHYASVCLKNRVLNYRRNRRRRNLDYEWTYTEESDEPVELRTWGAFGDQEDRMALREVSTAIQSLPERTRQVMWYKAQEYTDIEAADVLDMDIKEVRWRARVGRKTLRIATGRGDKTAQSTFIGVRRDGRKYTAAIRVKGKFIYLGIFEDPREAAKAYDKAARAHQGSRAKLNFPDIATKAKAA